MVTVMDIKKSPQIKVKPIVGQWKLLFDYHNTVLAAIAGTGGGKTALGYWWLTDRMTKFQGNTWGVAEPTFPMLSKILLNSPDPERPDLFKYFESIGHHPKYHAVEKIISTDCGQIYLGSADNPNSLQGAAVKGYWLDEAGMMGLTAYETALQRVAMMSGQVLLTTTPYNRGWLKTEVFDKTGTAGIHAERWRSIDRPNFPKKSYEDMQGRLSKARFGMMFDASFERPEALIYSDYDPLKHDIDPFPIPDEWPKQAGIDFGYNNPTAILKGAMNKDGILYLYDEYYESKRHIADHRHVLLESLARYIWADPSSKQEIAELNAGGGILVLPANNDVLVGIQRVIELFRTGRIRVFRNLRHLKDELENYVWDQKENISTDKPIKLDDHLCDALRYLVMGFMRAPTTIDII